MSGGYYVQLWLRCEHVGCDATVDVMVALRAAVYSHVTDRPSGWTHRGYVSEAGTWQCYGNSALCPTHSPTSTPRCECGGAS